MGITNKVKSIIGIKQTPDEMDAKILNSSHAISAKAAYMKSKYGRTLTQKDLLQKFFEKVNEQIQSRSMAGHYYCMIDIDDDIREFIPHITMQFRDKLGYKMAIIDKNTKICNPGENEVLLNPNSTFMILLWNTPDISETVFQVTNTKIDDEDITADSTDCTVDEIYYRPDDEPLKPENEKQQ